MKLLDFVNLLFSSPEPCSASETVVTMPEVSRLLKLGEQQARRAFAEAKSIGPNSQAEQLFLQAAKYYEAAGCAQERVQ